MPHVRKRGHSDQYFLTFRPSIFEVWRGLSTVSLFHDETIDPSPNPDQAAPSPDQAAPFKHFSFVATHLNGRHNGYIRSQQTSSALNGSQRSSGGLGEGPARQLASGLMRKFKWKMVSGGLLVRQCTGARMLRRSAWSTRTNLTNFEVCARFRCVSVTSRRHRDRARCSIARTASTQRA